MSRIRKDSQQIHTRYSDVSEFVSQTILEGAHTIPFGEVDLDILIENRGSSATLVVFHSAVPAKVTTYPVFAGRQLARDTGVNLISLSDPSLAIPGVNLAWHLGNSASGPLRDIWVKIISHTLESMASERTILFGTSGGGLAAANVANAFPGSVAFLVNPRLSFDQMSEEHLSNYFELCHGRDRIEQVTSSDLEFVSQYGLTNVADSVDEGMQHKIAVYQNLGDSRYLTRQVLPFFTAVGANPNVQVRFSPDDYGHKSIPGAVLRDMLRALAFEPTVEDGLRGAGFASYQDSIVTAFAEFPKLIRGTKNLQERVTKFKGQAEALRRQTDKMRADHARKLGGALARDEKTRQLLAAAKEEIADLKRQPAAVRHLVRGTSKVVTKISSQLAQRDR